MDVRRPAASGAFDRLYERALSRPEAVVLLAPGTPPLTAAQLAREAAKVGRVLRAVPVMGDGIVAAALPPGPESFVAFLATAPHAAFAPLDPAYPESELRAVLDRLRPEVLLTTRSSAARNAARRLGIPILCIEPTPERGAGLFDFAGAAEAEVEAERRPNLGDAALILHTSATTGQAKAITITHGNLTAMMDWVVAALELTESDRFLSVMPGFHLQALLSALEQVVIGGSVVWPGEFHAEQFIAWLNELEPTWYSAGPTLHRSIVALVRGADRRNWRTLRFIRSIGAALPAELLADLEQILAVPVIEGYGLTEAGTLTSNPLPPRVRKPGSGGIPIGPEMKLVDYRGNEVPRGEAGEILVRGASVAPASLKDGWLATGDLGRFDEDGYLFLSGRRKEMINRGGEKIAPHEVDAVLVSHPAVAEAAAFAIPHPRLGEDVAAVVVLRGDGPLQESDLRAYAAGRIALHKVPRRLRFVDAIPKSATGKPQRHLLAAEWEREALHQPDYRAPRSGIESALAAIWGRILNVHLVGLDDDFFAAGGDSFAATVMLTEVEERFGAIPEPARFFLHPTIASLAGFLEDQPARSTNGNANAAMIALQPRGSGIPLFCIPGAGEDPYFLWRLAACLGEDRPFLVLRDPRPVQLRGASSIEETAGLLLEVLRERQPRGPYLLSGHCFGGILAFELARQLADCGETVALLAMLDSPRPDYRNPLLHWKNYLRFATAAIREARMPVGEIAGHGKYLLEWAGRRMRAQLRRVTTKSQANGSPAVRELPPCATPEQRATANEAAARVYRPRPFGGRVVQFLAAEDKQSTRVLPDPRMGWKELALGGFEVVRVNATHISLLLEPAVNEVADTLRQRIHKSVSGG